MKSITPAILFAAMLGCAGGGERELRDRCVDARDRVIDIRLARLGASDGPLGAEIEKHRAAMKTSLGESYLDRCVQGGDRFADCIERAGDAAGLAACERLEVK